MIKNQVILKSILLLVLCVFATQADVVAQKRVPLVQHFTNTKCPICVNGNARLRNGFSNINNYNLITYYPSVPYSSCPLHQYEKNANQARQDKYEIRSTPKAVLGERVYFYSEANSLAVKANEMAEEDTPIAVQVAESGEESRTIAVKLEGLGDVGEDSLRLFVAMVEKELDFDADNGEKKHHNVFRGYAHGINGRVVPVPSAGSSATYEFNFDIPTAVKSDQAYAIAFVESVETGAVLNSGSKFNQTVTSKEKIFENSAFLTLRPNPVYDRLQIDLGKEYRQNATLEIVDVNGRSLYKSPFHSELLLSHLPAGMYFVRIKAKNTLHTKSFIKN